MDTLQLILHPFFFIPLFFVVGSIAILRLAFVKSSIVKMILNFLIVIGILIFVIPYAYMMFWWFLIEKLHWIR